MTISFTWSHCKICLHINNVIIKHGPSLLHYHGPYDIIYLLQLHLIGSQDIIHANICDLKQVDPCVTLSRTLLWTGVLETCPHEKLKVVPSAF